MSKLQVHQKTLCARFGWSLHCEHDFASADIAMQNTLLAQEFMRWTS